MKKSTVNMFKTHIAGIPCYIDVTHYDYTKGDPQGQTDLEYYGWTDFEFTVYDRKGYKAKWLEDKITDDDSDRIMSEYKDYLDSMVE